ncbi:hypothetical protein SAMN05444362_11329 [Dysgonomonas macrotermitis]|uniref:Uncharacterized protein n=1 Tax=Dysgonomonas macrotermitis TaxID=1346286 RepID=A0A1M5G2C5_9BACT|nr:hypothetical protein SAMN05444362_11329 [Dysgonomonas macrotermitis]
MFRISDMPLLFLSISKETFDILEQNKLENYKLKKK